MVGKRGGEFLGETADVEQLLTLAEGLEIFLGCALGQHDTHLVERPLKSLPRDPPLSRPKCPDHSLPVNLAFEVRLQLILRFGKGDKTLRQHRILLCQMRLPDPLLQFLHIDRFGPFKQHRLDDQFDINRCEHPQLLNEIVQLLVVP